MDTGKTTEELVRLQIENAALRAQGMLLDRFVAMLRSPPEGEMLKACLQQTLELATELTGAEKGSIFLLDERGAVTDSILTRQSPVADRSSLIGSVMDRGLAGWVCRHRVCGIVHDADSDRRWLPLKDQPYSVGSAMAVPIVRGEALFGILTLLHSRKRHFEENLVEAMQATADQIALVLENVKLYVELAKAKATSELYATALDRELEKGRKIQRDFLPSRTPQLPDLEIAAEFIPAMQVSGDFYDAFVLPGDLIGLVIGDVSDKGVGAALYMALIRSFIRMFAGQCCEKTLRQAPRNISEAALLDELQASALMALEITNDYLAREHDAEGMFATVFFGAIHPATGVIRYINAGHLPVYLINPNGIFESLRPTGPAVGLQSVTAFPCKELRLPVGSILFGYTDGVTDAQAPTGEMFGRQRLERLIGDTPLPTAGEAIRTVRRHLYTFVGSARQSDDITMLAVHRKR